MDGGLATRPEDTPVVRENGDPQPAGLTAARVASGPVQGARPAGLATYPRVCIYQRYLPPDASGAGKQAVTVAQALQRTGFAVTLLGDRSEDQQRPAELGGVPVEWVSVRKPGYPGLVLYWLRLAQRLFSMRRNFDVLHIHSAALDQSGAVMIARLLGKRAIIRSSISGEFAGLARSRSGRVQRQILRFCDRFILLSQRLADEYMASGLPPDRFRLIGNGVDEAVYHPVSRDAKHRLRSELGLPLNARIVVFHGVFMERKGLHWVVETLAGLMEKFDILLLFVGRPARDEEQTGYERRLRKVIESSPARARVMLREAVPDVHRYLQASDFYILASSAEGMPNALLEAMAVGLVPIVSRTSGTEDLVEDGVNGCLFELGDAASLEAAVERCCGDEASFEQRSAAANARIREDFGIDAIGRRLGELYCSVYESRRGRGQAQ